MRVLPFLLTVPALLAPRPAMAQASEPSFAQKAKEGLVAITPSLLKEDPVAALAKAKALLPEGGQLPFDKTNVQTASRSITEWRALLDVQSAAANAAQAAGQWEEAKALAEAARDKAKELQAEAFPPLNAYKDLWAKAKADAAKGLEDIKTLEAKAERTPEEVSQLTALKNNEATYKANIANGEKAIAGVDRNLKILADQTQDFDPIIQSIDARLNSEQEELIKFKTKAALSKGIVATIRKDHANLDNALNYLRRALVLDPSNRDASHYADVLLGKAVDKAAAKPAKKAPGKKAKK